MIRIMTVALFIAVLATTPASAHDDGDLQAHCFVTNVPVVLGGTVCPIQGLPSQACDTLCNDIGSVVGNR